MKLNEKAALQSDVGIETSAADFQIIENGICDACGKHAQYLQVVNCAPVVNACICRACLETDPPPNDKLCDPAHRGCRADQTLPNNPKALRGVRRSAWLEANVSMTKRQRQREQLAKLHEQIAGGKSEHAQLYRRQNRRVEMKKGRSK